MKRVQKALVSHTLWVQVGIRGPGIEDVCGIGCRGSCGAGVGFAVW